MFAVTAVQSIFWNVVWDNVSNVKIEKSKPVWNFHAFLMHPTSKENDHLYMKCLESYSAYLQKYPFILEVNIVL